MKGYYNNPDATAKAIDADGWLHSGDEATIDADGYVRITGRIKDLIIRGGENISPKEIEDCLREHPGVADAYVYGLPDDFFGEELFLRSHAEVVRAVLDGRADVGATYAQRPAPGQPIQRAGFLDVAPERSIRVLEWTRPIPNDVIVGHGLLSFAEHRAFGDAMLERSC